MATADFVKQLYTNLLGREAEPAGLAHWEAQIDTGALSSAQVTQSFLDSPEFSGVVTPVALLYYTTFSRIPDASGLAFWMQAYQSGTSMAAIADGFVNSTEFKNLYANDLSNADYVTALYRNVFNRAPDAE
ncbi:MAG: DUF4214 domain-containing protein, partial [Gammaproteobacteria bacterium]|nr:DUF4214 domain-containing protein [Gammaproteobacteria bacterium]